MGVIETGQLTFDESNRAGCSGMRVAIVYFLYNGPTTFGLEAWLKLLDEGVVKARTKCPRMSLDKDPKRRDLTMSKMKCT